MTILLEHAKTSCIFNLIFIGRKFVMEFIGNTFAVCNQKSPECQFAILLHIIRCYSINSNLSWVSSKIYNAKKVKEIYYSVQKIYKLFQEFLNIIWYKTEKLVLKVHANVLHLHKFPKAFITIETIHINYQKLFLVFIILYNLTKAFAMKMKVLS